MSLGTSSWSIGYDANGNRTGVTLNGSTRAYTTAATSNRLVGLSNPARSFSHDAAGNTTADSAAYTATYDLVGRLSTLTRAGATTTYNAQGERVRKHGPAGTVIFVHGQGGQLLGEYDASGQPIKEYLWLGSTPVAVIVSEPGGTRVHHVDADHLDTPRVVTDRQGHLRWRWWAEPFGATAPEDNPAGLGGLAYNLRFPGQYFDSESGLHYNYFRDYDASIGRYVQSDPIDLLGFFEPFIPGGRLGWGRGDLAV